VCPDVYIRCSTPGEVPAPAGARSGQLAAARQAGPVDELRTLVAEHGDLSARGLGLAPLSSIEFEYRDATGRALGRLEEAASVAAGPCSSEPADTADVTLFVRLTASLRDEADRHRELSAATDGPRDNEERRHGARALGLLDELERAYDDLESAARHRASVGCLWSGDV
jgi:hypothetical protein